MRNSSELGHLLTADDPDHEFKSSIKKEIFEQLFAPVNGSDEQIPLLDALMSFSIDKFCLLFCSLPEEIMLEKKEHLKKYVDWLFLSGGSNLVSFFSGNSPKI